MSTLQPFLVGAIAMASLVAALFFLKFWRQTRDRFFVMFSAAFAVDAVNRASIALLPDVLEEQEPVFYLLRLFAFTLILVAIVDKNLRGAKR